MKIVHIVFSLQTGGIENMLVDIINNQVVSNEVHLVVINNLYDESIINRLDAKVILRLLHRKPMSKGLYEIVKLNAILLKERFDIIHCHTHTVCKILFYRFLRKTILTVHAVSYNAKHFVKYKQLFAISKSVQLNLKEKYNLNSTVVYNGIDTNRIKTKRNIKKPDLFKIVCVGRLEHEEKGQDILIKSIAALRNAYHIKVDIIGDGRSYGYLDNLIKSLDLKDIVRLLGNKTRDYIYDTLKDYDIFIHPSNFEGFGLTVVEAMLAKLSVIVSDSYGPIEIIENGKYGFCFKKGNVDSLTKTIKHLFDTYNEKSTIELIEKAYSYAMEKFDVRITAKEYLKQYEFLHKR